MAKRNNSGISSDKNVYKKQKIKNLNPCIDDKWISATRLRNYMLNDPLIDWLNLYGESKGFVRDSKSNSALQNQLSFSSYIMNKGNEFEKYIVDEMKEKHTTNFVTVNNESLSPILLKYHRQINDTYDLMKNGTNIIYQGLVYNPKNKTYGYPDLIVRSDYLNKLTTHPVISLSDSKKGCSFSDKWHYRVVDIKFTTLKLKVDGQTLLNQGSVRPYKAQTYTYNQSVGFMQDFIPEEAYILGRGWTSGKTKICDPFDKLASIKFLKDDLYIEEDVFSAIEWVRDVRKNGANWDVFPKPTRPELYPNMCNATDHDWNKTTSMISKEISEITSIWQCGVKNRELSHASNIFKWDDKRCTAKKMGLSGKINPPIVDKILNINRGDSKFSVNNDTLKKSYSKWKQNDSSFFIDFETVSNIEDVKSSEDKGIIFMIGSGRTHDDNWKFESFTVDRLSICNEKIMILSFLDYLKELVGENNTCYLYHYSYAEPSQFNKTLDRHGIIPKVNIKWIDLLKVVKDNEFIVKGALNFSLKAVVSALWTQEMIDVNYDNNEVCNGSQAMVAAFVANKLADTHQTTIVNTELINCVRKYNEVDCLTLKCLLKVLTDLL